MDDGSIQNWALLWKILFVLVMAVFALMSVWVSIGGWADIKSLIKKLKDGDEDD